MPYLLLMLMAVALAGCAGRDPVGAGKPRGTGTKVVQGPQGEVELQVRQPEAAVITANSPQRQASIQVVVQGKQFLSRQDFEKALQLFQEAVTLDGSNGIAYYYIARTQYELGQYNHAAGVLDRAEALLAESQEWQMSIQALREAIRLSVAQRPQTPAI